MSGTCGALRQGATGMIAFGPSDSAGLSLTDHPYEGFRDRTRNDWCGVCMRSHSFPIKNLILSLAVGLVLVAICPAQEIGFLDMTQINARNDLRRPPATSPVTAYSGIGSATRCSDSKRNIPTLQSSLVSLDRALYQLGDEPIFEARIENIGDVPVRIPFSPHLADLQPQDPGQKFSYIELRITLWIASGNRWSTSTGGGLTLYGAEDHPNTTLSLHPGEWVRVVGKGHFALPDLVKDRIANSPADRIYAETLLYRQETLITPTQSATLGKEVCLAKAQGQSVSIRLVVP